MDFTVGHRETFTDVLAGDLVVVRLQHRDGTLAPDDKGLLPHLVYKPFFAGEDISARRRDHLHGNEDTTPEWLLDIGAFWAPLPGILALQGGRGGARFRVYHTVMHCRPDPGIEHTLSFLRTKAAIARPRGAAYVRVANPVTVRLTAAEYHMNVSMQPAGQRYPLGCATSIEPLALTSLFFGIVL
jgi:hypothetical protein